MKHILLAAFAFVYMLPVSIPAQTDKNFNLIMGDDFKPMRMEGEDTAAYGWNILDYGRITHTRSPSKSGFIDGRDCFKLDFIDGMLTIKFSETINDDYCKQAWSLFPAFHRAPEIPADGYHFQGEVRLDKGSFTAPGGPLLRASEQWQKFDYIKKDWGLSYRLQPAKDMTISLRNFSITPTYKKKEGEIALPGGGTMTRIVLPDDAPFYLRRTAHCWRGWLWKLTGTALPVHEEKNPQSIKGALVFVAGHNNTGGYQFILDQRGGTLIYDSPFAANHALFNYLREFGFKVFDRNKRSAFPKTDPERALLAANVSNKPKFKILRDSGDHTTGKSYYGNVEAMDYIGGTANWYAYSRNTEYHVSHQLMPPLDYRRRHPESQMMFANGRRQAHEATKSHVMMSPCLSDPYTRNYMIRRYVDWMKAFDYCTDFGYCLGDRPDYYCHCKRCREGNQDKTHASYSSVMLDFLNEVARFTADKCPRQFVSLTAYHTYAAPPENTQIEKNLKVAFCITGLEKKCNLHIDCALNDKSSWKKNLLEWEKLLGKENLGVVTYDNHNPFALLDYLEFLSLHASDSLQSFGLSMCAQYVASRWNQGDDPAGIVADYCNGVYGKAGPFVSEAHRLVYEYDKKHEHLKNEFSGNPGRIRYLENLDRDIFDAVYALLDKGFSAIRESQTDEIPLCWEKFNYMTTDLRKFPRSTCRSERELTAFALRVAEFIRLSDKLSKDSRYPYYTAATAFTDWQTPARIFMQSFCGLEIPASKKYWTDETVIQEFLQAPIKNMSSEPERMPGHWRFPASILRGGESGTAKILRRQSSGKGNIVAAWNLEYKPKGDVLLSFSGWDDEKPGKTKFEVLVNGGKIFSGENSLPEAVNPGDMKPGYMAFAIPAKLLVKGENQIEFVNLVQDDPAKTIKALANPVKPEDGFAEREDYFWGWMAINELRLTAIDDEFDKFSRGEKSAWTVWRQHLPHGIVQCGDEQVSISSAGARYTGIIVEIPNNRWLLPKGVQFKMRVKASGKGKFVSGLLCYPSDENGVRGNGYFWSSMHEDLTAEGKIFEKVVSQQVFGYCCPIVSLVGDGDMKIHELSFAPLP